MLNRHRQQRCGVRTFFARQCDASDLEHFDKSHNFVKNIHNYKQLRPTIRQ